MNNDHSKHLRIAILCLAAGGGIAASFTHSAFAADCGVFMPEILPATNSPISYAVALADFNNDGTLDAAVGNDGPDQIFFMTTNGFYPIITDSGQRLGTDITCGVTSGDLNGDLMPDLLVTGPEGGRLWYNNGAGLFTTSALIITNTFCTGAAIGDLNGDGFNDLFVVRGYPIYGLKNLVFTNNGTGRFTAVNQSAFIMDRSYAVALGDLDNDGDLDAYVANSVANRCYRNNGKAVFAAWGADSRMDDTRGVALADFNGDGYLDVVAANAWPGPNAVYLNRTNGVLQYFPLSAPGSDGMGVVATDLDGDLRPDIATVGWGGNTVWFNVDGTNFTPSLQPMGYDLGQAVASGDVNGDGSADLLMVNYSSTNTLWLNQCLPEHVVLWVLSQHSAAGPVVQSITNDKSSVVTNTMDGFVVQGQTQFVCSGWALAGNQPASGAGTNAIFTQTNNAVLLWNWNTNYWLDTPAGQVTPSSGWQPANTLLLVTALDTIPYYHFAAWTGSVDPGSASSNPLSLLMDAPKALAVSNAPNLATNNTPEWWLASFGWTNDFDTAALNDADGDHALTWQEYQADTLPTDSNSVLYIQLLSATGSQSSVQWGGGTVSVQYLEYATGLLSNTWATLATNLPPTPLTNALTTGTDTLSGFYRIRVTR